MGIKPDLGLCLLILTSLLSAAGALAQGGADASENAVMADTQAASRKQGMVRIGKTVWKCSDRRCTVRVGNPAQNVHTCQALAELVGPLTRFGRPNQPIPSYDLALCNVRAQIKLARIEEERRRAQAGRSNGSSREAPQVAIPPVVQARSVAPINIRVAPLSLSGVAEADTSGPSLGAGSTSDPVRVAVAPLEIVGHGRLLEASSGTYLTIEVPKLELLGQ